MKGLKYISLLFLIASAALRASDRDLVVEWKAVPGAAKYELKVTAGDGTSKTYSVKGLSFHRKLTPGYYHYALRTWDRFDRPSRWTPPADLKIAPGLSKPIYPLQASTTINLSPTVPGFRLRWEAGSGAQEYEIEVREGNQTILAQKLKATESFIEPPKPGRYEWRVRSVLSDFKEVAAVGPIASEWSEWKPFEVKFPVLAAPSLEKPRTRSLSIEDSAIRLQWKEVANAKAYEVTWQPKLGRQPASTGIRRKVTKATKLDLKVPADGVYDLTVRALASETPTERFDGAASQTKVSFLDVPDFTERDKISLSSIPRFYSYNDFSGDINLNAETNGMAVGFEAAWKHVFDRAWSTDLRVSNTSYQLSYDDGVDSTDNPETTASTQRLSIDVVRRFDLTENRKWVLNTSLGLVTQRHLELLRDDTWTTTFVAPTGVLTIGPKVEVGVEYRWAKRWKSDLGIQAGIPLLMGAAVDGAKLEPGFTQFGVGFGTEYWMEEDWSVSLAVNYGQIGVNYLRTAPIAGSDSITDKGTSVSLAISYLWP